ncbi:hypothetical protein GCM10017783_21110 [Deinococcus piscis]|uniref:Superoxide dismutase copper/zinc binding domain-containing protein n=1 Tax=Deinococcus piscis TaxID=394230 RepID=A0ABQ3KCB3_9DEIO|nr:superoxide dismutase family protein [Deinococcus piscis]GHG08326.1 hypothetical protein GCM10017783_21110 [Deinococcus piscis]
MNRTRTLLLLPLAALSLSSLAAAGGGYVPAPAPVAAPAPVTVPRAPVATPAAASTTTVTASTVTAPTTASQTATETAAATSGGMGLTTATAQLRDASGAVKGAVTFSQLPGNELLVSVQAEGLTPGKHGMHVHAVGQCSDKVVDGKPTVFGAAEGHFDPAATGKHATPETPTTQAHAGDLPMLEVGADGRGRADFSTRKFSVQGDTGVVGRSLIVHAGEDDYQTNPAGNSGARVLCGVIETASN